MDDMLEQAATANGGYLFRHQLNRLGYSDKHLSAMRRTGALVRFRHGSYTTHLIWTTASPAERHAIATRSVLDRLGPDVAASHVSAAILHGLDVWGVDLSTVHVTRLDGRSGRTEAGVDHHENTVDREGDVVLVDGRLVIAPARAAAETATITSIEAGMVTLSSALRNGVSSRELEQVCRRLVRWPGFARVQIAYRLADGRLESVGEVRSLYLMWQFRLPHPELQCELVVAGGQLVRPDFTWTLYRHVGEFDGLVKYGRLNAFSREPGRVIVEEKIREDAIRDLSYGVSRWTWTGLEPDHREQTAQLIRAGVERSKRLYTRNAVHIG